MYKIACNFFTCFFSISNCHICNQNFFQERLAKSPIDKLNNDIGKPIINNDKPSCSGYGLHVMATKKLPENKTIYLNSFDKCQYLK